MRRSIPAALLLDARKPVFGVECKLAVGEFCPLANTRDLNFLKRLTLESMARALPGSRSI